MNEKPGTNARRILGGDDAVHVFDSQRKAIEYGLRMPGARTLAPNPRRKAGGWGGFINECRERPLGKDVRDRKVIIEVDICPHPDTRKLIRSLAQELYKAGALEVRCLGRLVLREPHQRELAWR